MAPLFIEKLSKRLDECLPGRAAQEIMMIRPKRFKSKVNQKKVPAAVLILLYPFDNEWYFFLTKRTKTVEHHKGQISFPGGMVEKSESYKNAALRETFEEIGVSMKEINIIGALTPLYVPVSKFEIFPFIGWTPKKPETVIHDIEVDRIFSPSIKNLMLEETKKERRDILSDSSIAVPYFDLDGEVVWGATSIILSEFKAILEEAL